MKHCYSLVILTLICSVSMVAQPADAPRPPFHLDLIPSLRTKWEGHPKLLRWAAFEGLEWKTDGRPPSQAFRTQLGLAPDTPWVLTDNDGQLITFGIEELDLDRVRWALETRGWKPSESRRRSFLQDNPKHVEAQREEVLCHLKYVALLSISRKEQNRNGVDSHWSEALAGLEAAFSVLIQMQGWTDHLSANFWGAWRLFSLFEDQPFHSTFQPVAIRALNDMEEAIRLEPSRRDLWSFWTVLSNLSSLGNPPLELLKGLDPIPGIPYPPSVAANRGYYESRRDWQGLLDYGRWGWELSKAPLQNQKSTRSSVKTSQSHAESGLEKAQEISLAEDEAARRSRVLCWGEAISSALIELERSDELMSWFRELRSEAGKEWISSSERNLSLISALKPLLLSNELKELLKSPPLPPLQSATSYENPDIRLAWPLEIGICKLSQDPAFDAWGPEELERRGLSQQEWESLRHLNQWGPEARWVLLRGSEMLGSGGIAGHNPESIAQSLRGFSLPRLESLGAYIRSHPESIDARKARLALLKSRMPHPRLVPLFLEDAAATLTSPVVEGIRVPDSAVPEPLTKAVLARLEERLFAFPSEGSLWSAYVGWSSYLPQGGARLTRTAGSIPVFGDRAKWAKGLPDTVSSAIGEAYAKQNEWDALESWCSHLNEKGKKLAIRLKANLRAQRPSQTGVQKAVPGEK